MKRAGANLFRVGQEAEEVRRHGETDRIADFDVRATLSRSVRPRILITGRPEIRAQYAASIDRDRYFEKPFDGQQLLAAIRAAVEGARPKGAA